MRTSNPQHQDQEWTACFVRFSVVFATYSTVITSRFCRIKCAGTIMKNLIFVAAILTCVAVTAFAQPAWQFASKQMLVASGLSVNADRFEVVSADRCEAFELRIWARVFDKNSNLLEADDYVDLQLSLAEMHIAQGGRVIDIAKNFSDEFDVVYLVIWLLGLGNDELV